MGVELFKSYKAVWRPLLYVLALLFAVAARADWEAWQRPMVYGATFEQYEDAQVLSDIGAVNGTWGVPPTPAGGLTEAEGGCMRYSVPEGAGIRFTPNSTGDRNLKSVRTFMQLQSIVPLPELDDKVRASLALSVVGSSTNFYGWGRVSPDAAVAWHALRDVTGSVVAKDGWQDVSVRFVKGPDGNLRIQYRLGVGSGENEKFVSLALAQEEGGSTWLYAGGEDSDPMVNCVEFRGEGCFEMLDGSEPQRGLTAGVGNWYDTLFDESVVKHNTGYWKTAAPGTYGDDYVISVATNEPPNTFVPSAAQDGRFVVSKFAVRFLGASMDDSVPEGACARIRVVEGDGDGYRFACLVDGAWVTNRVVDVDVSAKYTIEVGLDRVDRTVSYRAKKGYGAEGSTNVVLCVGKIADGASGQFKSIDFEGSGYLREIRGVDKSGTVR